MCGIMCFNIYADKNWDLEICIKKNENNYKIQIKQDKLSDYCHNKNMIHWWWSNLKKSTDFSKKLVSPLSILSRKH